MFNSSKKINSLFDMKPCVQMFEDFPNVIFIEGAIEKEAASLFYTFIHKIDYRAPLFIVINSVGGELTAALTIIDLIDVIRNKTGVITVACGEAYSAGALLLSAGDPGYRFISESSYTMVHDVQTFAHGNFSTEVVPSIQHVKEARERYIDKLAEFTSRPQEGKKDVDIKTAKNKILKLFEQGDVFLNSKKTIEYRLADELGLPLLQMPEGLVEKTSAKKETKKKAPAKKAVPSKTKKSKGNSK